MKTESFTTSFTVDRSPKQVFDAINDVRAWWSGNIDGRTDALGAEFTYRYGRIHRTTQKITELVPNQKVVWHVTDSFINFKDTDEWSGTDVVFEIADKGGETEVRFTHVGLVPSFECYDACRKGWTFYVQESLRKLITSGQGEPAKAEKSFTKSFTVKATPERVFDAINDVRGWWSNNIEGKTDALGASFVFRYKDLHRSTHEVREFVRGKKVVWHTIKAEIHFVKDPSEWDHTDVVFDIEKKGDETEVRFTHVGMVPSLECYGECSRGWGFHLDSLREMITT